MKHAIDPASASVDELIKWLGELRQSDSTSALSHLLKDHQLDPDRLVDIACIDLMQRIRAGCEVKTEDYLSEFPVLNNDSSQLDLIDAELCVAHELGSEREVEHWIQRFPHLETQIRELAQLDPGAKSGLTHALLNLESRSIATASGEFSVEIKRGELEPASPLTDNWAKHPIDTPDWFVADDCVASSPGRWLIRGRDNVRRTSLALKVTQLPAQLTSNQSSQLLDACEVASKVRNPCWILPSVAAIQQRHLGVIRPWLFARPWQQVLPTLNQSAQLKLFAAVAFAIAAGHQNGATHGGVHAENLMVDHEGSPLLLDAASSRDGLSRWLQACEANDDEIASLKQRMRWDIQDFTKLVAAASMEWNAPPSSDVLDEIQRIANAANADLRDASYQIGNRLIRIADQPTLTTSSTSWRQRLASWLTKDGR